MVITAMELAKYIISKCEQDNVPISNLQLQKILYYIQYESLKKTNNCIFYDDIEAWQFGPVVPNVYYYFCNFGAMPINLKFENYKDIITDSQTLNLVNCVVDRQREQNPWDMVKETHKDNGPWYLTFKNGAGIGKVIYVDLIREYIKKIQ